VYGTPEYEQAQQTAAAAKNAPFTEGQRKYEDYLRSVDAAQNKAAQAQAQVAAVQPDLQNHLQEQQAHAAQAQRLQADMDSLRQNHEAITQQLTNAELEHEFHKTRDANVEFNKLKDRPYYGPNNRTWTTSNEASAANAARNRQATSVLGSLGLNPDEQIAKAPGMSATESGVLAPSEVVNEQAQQKQTIIDDIAASQDAAKKKIDALKTQKENVLAKIKDQRTALSEHARAAPKLPAIVDSAQNAARAADTEYQRLLAAHPAPPTPAPPPSGVSKYLNSGNLARLGRFGSRFIPGVGAMAAPHEAEQALEDYRKGNYGRMVAHGLGTAGALAQATGNPIAMGLGDIAQLPSVAYGAYDLFSHPEAPAGGLPGPK
jgi:hypothetical protein